MSKIKKDYELPLTRKNQYVGLSNHSFERIRHAVVEMEQTSSFGGDATVTQTRKSKPSKVAVNS